MRKAMIVVIVLASAVGAVLLAGRSSPTYTLIEGHVYAEFDPVRGPVSPIAEAIVSNDWDDTTTKTDVVGRFALRVRRVAPDEFLALRARAGEKEACRRMAGFRGEGGHRIDLFADGGPHAVQKCSQ